MSIFTISTISLEITRISQLASITRIIRFLRTTRFTRITRFARITRFIRITRPGCDKYSNIFRWKYLFVSYSYDFFDTIKFGYWFVWFFDKYIFGYSIVLFFWYKYIRILICIVFWYEYIQEKNLAWGPKSPKAKWLKMFTHRSIQNCV